MKIISGPAGSGKTFKLLRMAAEMPNGYLVVRDHDMAAAIQQRALGLGLQIGGVITFVDFVAHWYRCAGPNARFLIDDVDELLRYVARGCVVEVMSVSTRRPDPNDWDDAVFEVLDAWAGSDSHEESQAKGYLMNWLTSRGELGEIEAAAAAAVLKAAARGDLVPRARRQDEVEFKLLKLTDREREQIGWQGRLNMMAAELNLDGHAGLHRHYAPQWTEESIKESVTARPDPRQHTCPHRAYGGCYPEGKRHCGPTCACDCHKEDEGE
jgi:hypothetical protein